MATGIAVWSTTAATNSGSDSAVNWAEGQAPSSVNDSARGMMAAAAKWRDDHNGTLTTAGSSTVYTLTSNQVFGALTAGYEIAFCLDEANGATVTLNVDGLGAKPLRPAPGVELDAGVLKAGVPYRATYFTSNSGEWVLHGAKQSALTDLQITAATALTAPAVDDELPIYDLDATTNKKITLANALKVINGLTEDTSPDRTADFVATWDNSASAAKKVKLSNIPSNLPPGFISGCILSNGTDATNDIDIAAGYCRDSTNTVDIVLSAIAGKQLDANWAAGATAGMRNSAAGIANGTYHLYAARTAASSAGDVYAYAGVAGTDPDDPTNVATVLTALQAETGGSDYAYLRRIGSILRESAAVVGFVQDGDLFMRKATVLDINVSAPGTSSVTRALSVPSGVRVDAEVTVGCETTRTEGTFVRLSDLNTTDEVASVNNSHVIPDKTGGGADAAVVRVMTNTSRQIRSLVSNSVSTTGTTLYIRTRGWVDARGRI